jgi:non-ribosomal peptide synthetase component E (peptide arylation enzyme)
MLEGCSPWPPELAARYRARGYWQGLALGDLVDRWAFDYGEREALVSASERITYHELAQRVDRLAHHLLHLGLRAPQRIVVQLPNVPEFVYPGDVVRLSPAGNLIVEGCDKDMINRGGEKISAEEIENLILSHPAVFNAAVVAMPDPVLGERTCAYVVLKPNSSLTLPQLIAFLRRKQIASFKLPERLEVAESFPLTSIGKVSKKDLRADIARKRGAKS